MASIDKQFLNLKSHVSLAARGVCWPIRRSAVTMQEKMTDWKQITARIRRARTSKIPAGQLSNLYQKTRDAMVAFELAKYFETSGQNADARKMVFRCSGEIPPVGLEKSKRRKPRYCLEARRGRFLWMPAFANRRVCVDAACGFDTRAGFTVRTESRSARIFGWR